MPQLLGPEHFQAARLGISPEAAILLQGGQRVSNAIGGAAQAARATRAAFASDRQANARRAAEEVRMRFEQEKLRERIRQFDAGQGARDQQARLNGLKLRSAEADLADEQALRDAGLGVVGQAVMDAEPKTPQFTGLGGGVNINGLNGILPEPGQFGTPGQENFDPNFDGGFNQGEGDFVSQIISRIREFRDQAGTANTADQFDFLGGELGALRSETNSLIAAAESIEDPDLRRSSKASAKALSNELKIAEEALSESISKSDNSKEIFNDTASELESGLSKINSDFKRGLDDISDDSDQRKQDIVIDQQKKLGDLDQAIADVTVNFPEKTGAQIDSELQFARSSGLTEFLQTVKSKADRAIWRKFWEAANATSGQSSQVQTAPAQQSSPSNFDAFSVLE